MEYISYCVASILAFVFGQLVNHLNKKLPPVVAEEIGYKEFFKSLKTDFKIDIFFSMIFIILFNSFIYFLGSHLNSYLYMLICPALAVTFTIDLKIQLIPDEVHVLIAFVGIINLLFHIGNWWNYLLGAAIGGAIFWGLGMLSLLIFKKEGMGFGDVKLMAALGLLFGIKYILVIALLSFFFGAIIGGIVLIAKKKENDGYIPFGPFIVIGVLIVIFIPADEIINIYITFCSWLGMKMSDFVYYIMTKFNMV
ncbi:MAG: A24 family peptidase [Clostridia bacterium]|nr:A24 family peptidase [Clostridia bacterium]